jgi:GDP-L-fucose synthase
MKIYVAGHESMVGAAIVRLLQAQGQDEVLTCPEQALDLTRQAAVEAFFADHRPDQVYLAAGKTGGVHEGNSYPADFIYQNMMIEANIIQAAHAHDVQQLVFVASNDVYPPAAAQPALEGAILSGVLEAAREPDAVAKIAGIKLCESFSRQHGRDYRSVVPTSVFGLGDNYHPDNHHVVPAFIRGFHEAKLLNAPSVSVWGTGTPMREYIFADDVADACIYLMNLDKATFEAHTQPMLSHVNVGTGFEISIGDLAQAVADMVGYEGEVLCDPSRPDGVPRKVVDGTRLYALGWQAQVGLGVGLRLAFEDYLNNHVHKDAPPLLAQ